jgi:2,3-dihydroxybenzoate-AMP ligase
MLDGCTPWPEETAERYRRDGLWRGEDLGQLPDRWARRWGGRVALVDQHTRLTYGELSTRVARTAAGLRRRGVAPGDRVVLQLPNVCEFVVVAFALFRLGAKPVFCLTSHREFEVRHLCEASQAVACVVPGRYRGYDHAGLARQLLDEIPTLRQAFVLDVPGAGEDGAAGSGVGERVIPLADVDAPRERAYDNDPGDVAFFLLSGGTTALPKLIPRTHDDYAYQTRAVAEVCEVTSDDVYLAVLPAEFNFAWGCPGVVGTLGSGGRAVLSADATPAEVFEVIERERVTVTSLVPTMAQLWLDVASWAGADLSSLRLVQIGGARLQPELAARVEPELGCRLQQVFGMAEGLLTMTRPGDGGDAVITTQGTPVSPADEIRIVGEDGADRPPGALGELWARGPYTLRGYYRAAEHNRAAFTADGFYRTGDLARLTPEGRLVVDGRIKDVIIRAGEKISGGEVEGHLLAHPAVTAAAVVGGADEFLGERIHAFLICRGAPPDLPELKGFMRGRGVADTKLPDRVDFVADFPLTPLGKVDKKALAASAATS